MKFSSRIESCGLSPMRKFASVAAEAEVAAKTNATARNCEAMRFIVQPHLIFKGKPAERLGGFAPT